MIGLGAPGYGLTRLIMNEPGNRIVQNPAPLGHSAIALKNPGEGFEFGALKQFPCDPSLMHNRRVLLVGETHGKFDELKESLMLAANAGKLNLGMEGLPHNYVFPLANTFGIESEGLYLLNSMLLAYKEHLFADSPRREVANQIGLRSSAENAFFSLVLMAPGADLVKGTDTRALPEPEKSFRRYMRTQFDEVKGGGPALDSDLRTALVERLNGHFQALPRVSRLRILQMLIDAQLFGIQAQSKNERFVAFARSTIQKLGRPNLKVSDLDIDSQFGLALALRNQGFVAGIVKALCEGSSLPIAVVMGTLHLSGVRRELDRLAKSTGVSLDVAQVNLNDLEEGTLLPTIQRLLSQETLVKDSLD